MRTIYNYHRLHVPSLSKSKIKSRKIRIKYYNPIQLHSLLRYLSHNTEFVRAYWPLKNLLLNTLYENERTSNVSTEFELIEFSNSIFGPDPQN